MGVGAATGLQVFFLSHAPHHPACPMYLVWVSGSEEEGSSTRGQQEQRWGRWKQVSANVTALLALRLLILLIIRRGGIRDRRQPNAQWTQKWRKCDNQSRYAEYRQTQERTQTMRPRNKNPDSANLGYRRTQSKPRPRKCNRLFRVPPNTGCGPRPCDTDPDSEDRIPGTTRRRSGPRPRDTETRTQRKATPQLRVPLTAGKWSLFVHREDSDDRRRRRQRQRRQRRRRRQRAR